MDIIHVGLAERGNSEARQCERDRERERAQSGTELDGWEIFAQAGLSRVPGENLTATVELRPSGEMTSAIHLREAGHKYLF